MGWKHRIGEVVNALLKPKGVMLARIEQVRTQAEGPVNDGTYWDMYVRQWEESKQNADLKHVGDEWKNEEIFLSLLERHSSRDRDAIEIGCGGGRITARAVPWFRHVHACDVSREMLRKNKESIRASNVSHHVLDGFTLEEFPDESIDCVFSHDVFVHFSSLQVYPYFAEIRRVLKKGGVGVVSFYNFSRHFDLFRQMSMEFNRLHVYPPHMRVHFVTEQMVERMLEDLSLTIEEVDRTNFLIAVFRKGG